MEELEDVRSCCEWRQVPDLPMSRIAEMMGRIYAADDIHALEFYGKSVNIAEARK
jgi:hypothetical protein